LKSIYDSKLESNNQFDTQESKSDSIKIDVPEESSEFDISSKLKSLYRIIAKSTHPDKVNDENLKELYLEATLTMKAIT
jgi:hypothetical protein